MSDIDDNDWQRILDAFREAYPNDYPDRSQIVGEMVGLYIDSLKPQPEPITAPNGTCAPTYRGLPPPESLSIGTPNVVYRRCVDCKHWTQTNAAVVPSMHESGKFTMVGLGRCTHPAHVNHQAILLRADNFCADFDPKPSG